MDIDTNNDFLVGVQGDRVIVMLPQRSMTKEQAIRHAAYIVALADQSEGHGGFRKVLDAVEGL